MRNKLRVRRQIVLVVLACCMLLCACAVGNNSKASQITVTTNLEGKPVLVGNIPCEFPLVKEETPMTFMMAGYEDVDANNIYVWKKYNEMTGVNVNWITIPKKESGEYINNALMNKQNLDLVIRCGTTVKKLDQLGKNGYVYDLAKDDLLKNNAPNCWAYLQAHPEALASVTTPEGAIYSLPQVSAGPEFRVSRKIYVNKNWLKNVGMELPTTTEELYQLLKAFKEQDANGNGDPTDEIPFCTQDWSSARDVFIGPFGLGNRGVLNKIVDCDETTGGVRLIYSASEYKMMLEYLNKLYSEGLIDNNLFTMDMDQWINDAKSDRIGVFANTNLATLPSEATDNFIAIEEALEGPTGIKMCNAIRPNMHSTGAAFIPATCKNPELVLRWLDYFWTDEGTLFYHLGIENETFIVKEDGSYDYAPAIYEKMEKENLSFDDVIAQYTPYPGGSNPTVEIVPYIGGGEKVLPREAARKLFEYGPKEYWPIFTFTDDELNTMEGCQADIKKYGDAALVDFITGKKSFSEWDDYVAQIDQFGADTVVNTYQAAVDRYHDLLKTMNK